MPKYEKILSEILDLGRVMEYVEPQNQSSAEQFNSSVHEKLTDMCTTLSRSFQLSWGKPCEIDIKWFTGKAMDIRTMTFVSTKGLTKKTMEDRNLEHSFIDFHKLVTHYLVSQEQQSILVTNFSSHGCVDWKAFQKSSAFYNKSWLPIPEMIRRYIDWPLKDSLMSGIVTCIVLPQQKNSATTIGLVLVSSKYTTVIKRFYSYGGKELLYNFTRAAVQPIIGAVYDKGKIIP